MTPVYSIVVKAGSTQQKYDDQHDQPDRQRADKNRNHRQHDGDVSKNDKELTNLKPRPFKALILKSGVPTQFHCWSPFSQKTR
jgi:hypothetical protein